MSAAVDPTMPYEDHEHADQDDDLAVQLAVAHQRLEAGARRHPWPAVAAAFGVGVVLGGGIPTWALRLAAASAARIAAAQLVTTLTTPASAD